MITSHGNRMKNTPYSCILNSLLYTPLPQAPSLLITLIQMFLEFSKAPNDYVTRKPDDDPDLLNEYSVFGSDQTHGAIQVHYTPFVQYQYHTDVSHGFAYCMVLVKSLTEIFNHQCSTYVTPDNVPLP